MFLHESPEKPTWLIIDSDAGVFSSPSGKKKIFFFFFSLCEFSLLQNAIRFWLLRLKKLF
jgi:hypothetical protein